MVNLAVCSSIWSKLTESDSGKSLLVDGEPVELIEKHLGFPVVVKTLSGSQGSGVFLSENKSSFKDLMELIEATNKTANIVLQEFISGSHGRDLRVFTIGGRVVATMLRTAQEGEFKANFSIGGTVEEYPTSPGGRTIATPPARAPRGSRQHALPRERG